MSSENPASEECKSKTNNISPDEQLYLQLLENNMLQDIWLSKDEAIALIKFSQIWYTADKISQCIGMSGKNHTRFIADFNNPLSAIRQIHDLAKLKQAAEIKANAALRAKESVSGEKAFRELEKADEIKELKKALVPSLISPQIHEPLVSDLPRVKTEFKDLQLFFEQGDPDVEIPAFLQVYWTKLNIAHDMLKNFNFRAKGKKYICSILRKKFNCTEQYAYRIINEASYFFNITEDKSLLLKNLYDDLNTNKAVAWAKDDEKAFNEACKIQLEVIKAMRDSSDIPPELFEGRMIITSHDPGEFGIEPVPRENLIARIRKFNISQEDKKRLTNELQITSDNNSTENLPE